MRYRGNGKDYKEREDEAVLPLLPCAWRRNFACVFVLNTLCTLCIGASRGALLGRPPLGRPPLGHPPVRRPALKLPRQGLPSYLKGSGDRRKNNYTFDACQSRPDTF